MFLATVELIPGYKPTKYISPEIAPIENISQEVGLPPAECSNILKAKIWKLALTRGVRSFASGQLSSAVTSPPGQATRSNAYPVTCPRASPLTDVGWLGSGLRLDLVGRVRSTG